MERDITIENYAKYYRIDAVCRNCGAQVARYLEKGTVRSGQTCDCDLCGCVVTFAQVWGKIS